MFIDDDTSGSRLFPKSRLVRLASYDTSCAIQARHSKEAEDQSFEVLLKKYTKRCSEVKYTVTELERAKTPIANLQASVTRL